MQKMTFENGTLVTPAKVTIDGIEHEVTPAEYEGDTPLSAENLNELQNRIETAIEIGGVSGDTLPVGAIIPFGSITPPANWLVCNGQAVSRTEYALLFAVIGTTFGAGDGSTTFNIPNLKGKIPVGQDTAQTEFDTIGETGGEKTHILTVNEMPSHNHNSTALPFSGGSGTQKQAFLYKYTDDTTYSCFVQNIGGGQAHNNLQPYTVTQYIIKARQSAGVVADVEDSLTSTSATNALSANQGRVLNEKIEQKITTGVEIATNEWIDNKRVYRKRIDFGALPNQTTKQVNHGLTNFKIVRYFAYATKPDENISISIPYYNSTYSIEFSIYNTTIAISASNDRTAFNAYVDLYYTKNNQEA